MDYILARISTRKAENLRTVISDVTAYEIPLLDNVDDYNDELKLDEGQWFRIENFSQKEYCPEYLKTELNIIGLATITSDEFDKIKFLISFQNDDVFLFQRLFKSSVIENKSFLFFQDEPKLKQDQTLVVINSMPDAIYIKSINTLYFKDLAKISPIFKGIDTLFDEATDDEVDNFLSLDLITLAQGFDRQKVSKSNRKRVRNALHQYNAMTDDDKAQIKEYIKRYRPNLKFDEANIKFELGCDNDCKDLMFGIDQRYYTTIVGNHDRVANSVTAI